METEFLPNNTHLHSPNNFADLDPHLQRMKEQKYIFHSSIIDELPKEIPGIYNLGGGRQIGKTTLLKQWMLILLQKGKHPNAIAFLSCELIVDETSLYRILINQLNDMEKEGIRYLILDEITYVKNWDRAIKYLADTGAFEKVVVVISGSDLVMMQDARKRFPGRRGKAEKVDFHFYPLSFRESIQLTKQFPGEFDSKVPPQSETTQMLFEEFNNYCIHGGFLVAINEFATTGTICNRTLATYSDWIRGDVIKNGKKEHYLREIVGAIIKHYSSQISWRQLVNALSVEHTQTAIEYISLLESMDAVFIQSALIEDKLVAAPKKHRKFMFCDPFIYHAMRAWLTPTSNPFEDQINKAMKDPILCSLIVESVVATHFRRHYPTYYIKADSEVDIAYIDKNKFWPIEIKWTNQLRPNELKQILKYKNGKIWAKVNNESKIGATPILPLPWALLTV
ncbi:MAG TPA: ATP-binding protein [Gammaproteobacteria bacterium]|nr:ATP-binding protein [Gammaproteobacteria bacterium]